VCAELTSRPERGTLAMLHDGNMKVA